jgi:peptidoglycan hydrolase CwlO-like protein
VLILSKPNLIVRDTKTLLLGLLSFGLVATWVYHLYDKTQYSNRRKEIYVKDSTAVAQAIKDSLQHIYSVAITDLDQKLARTRNATDSIQTALDVKLSEVQNLRGEIDQILKNRNSSKADLDLARRKINELQGLVQELEGEKDSMEQERSRLNNVLDQLTGDIASLQQNIHNLGEENRKLADKVNLASVFVASELKLTPVAVKNAKEQETDQAKKASKFIVSFTLQNNVNEYDNADVYVVITQPNGQVLKNDDIWDATFTSQANGSRLSYTRVVRFDYRKGEAKKLFFSINADQYQKGDYRLEVFHKGYEIGETTKVLN